MNAAELNKYPHRRLNILTGEWVMVSPHRMKRPWQGKTEAPVRQATKPYDKECYLCPGNERAGGVSNPDYKGTFVFDNDFAALHSCISISEYNVDNMLKAQTESGICRVVCFDPDHSKTLADLSITQIRAVIDTWILEYLSLGSRPEINYVQIFENKGEMMGCSNPHPHGQIWAQYSIPGEVMKEQQHMCDHYERMKSSLLADYIEVEKRENKRIVFENEHFIIVVPFWAIWPFETLLLSKRHLQSIDQLTPAERNGMASAMKELTTKYDALFNISFPYSAGIHQKPTDGKVHPEWHFHMHFYPPLLRSATVKKFMVGYEMLGSPQRDMTPELAAAMLRNINEAAIA